MRRSLGWLAQAVGPLLGGKVGHTDKVTVGFSGVEIRTRPVYAKNALEDKNEIHGEFMANIHT